MKHEALSWISHDGLYLFGQLWEPEEAPTTEAPKAVVCLVHGYGEHSGRYEHVGAALTAAGYALMAADLRGHGRSAGQRGYTPGYNDILHDTRQLLSQAAERFPNYPLFLYGHSMGGNIALNYALRYRPLLAGVVATSPWLRLTTPPNPALFGLMQVMNRLWPKFTPKLPELAEGLSRDKLIAQTYLDDPLVHNKMSARLAICIHDAGEWALAHAAEFSLPLLIMHGEADPVTSPLASRSFANMAPNCTCKLWPEMLHETHNELGQAAVLAALTGWLDGVLAATEKMPA